MVKKHRSKNKPLVEKTPFSESDPRAILGEKSIKEGPENLESQILSRLDRLESGIDNIKTVLYEIAKTEERVIQLMEADKEKQRWILKLQDQFFAYREATEKEIGALHSDITARKAVLSRVERGFWLCLTAFLTVAGGLFINYLKG